MVLRARNSTPTPPTRNTHIQSTPQQMDGWTCGIHMLLINLTTLYQGRIPTLTHTQQHAESLSRSHLKYVITGELDTYVTNLIHNLTIPAQHVPRIHHTRRKKYTQPTHNIPTPHAPPSTTPTTRKGTHTPTHNQTHYQPLPLTPTNNPLQKSRQSDATTLHTHSPITHPLNI